MCGNISVERSPIFSRFSCRSVTQYGREQMSMTARESAWCTVMGQSLSGLLWISGKEGESDLVKGSKARAVATDTAHFSECLLERGPKCNRAILCG